MFNTSNVYRETGTVSRYVTDEAFAASLQMESNKKKSAVDKKGPSMMRVP